MKKNLHLQKDVKVIKNKNQSELLEIIKIKSPSNEKKVEKKLPILKSSISSDNFDKIIENIKMNNQNSKRGVNNISFISKTPMYSKLIKKKSK